jgi:predicted Fe-Mo cluster-binding NifX family protein
MNFPDGHELAFTQKYLKENPMNSTIVAIPSSHPGGLEAALGAHFGHCDLYTVVKIADGAVQEVKTLPNVPHQQGGCMAPVNHLAQNGVQILIAGGMGMRPLMGFNQVGIDVLYGAGAQTVGEAVDALLRGSLQQFTREFTCGGGAPQTGGI